MTSRAARLAVALAGLTTLILLAVANAGGYRYGVSDQAFYLPSIALAGDATLFPRDAALLQAQARLMVTDELTAALVGIGLPQPSLLLAGHIASLGCLFSAIWLVARRFAASRWTAAACCLAGTLRHRITETGANTFEGYYHPRGLAFAVGAMAAAAFLRRRLGWAAALTAVAVVLHPTTGGWWAIWLVAATVVSRWQSAGAADERAAAAAPLPWRAVAASAAIVIVASAVVLVGIVPRMPVMDEAWIAAFAWKDYVFPTAWKADAWLANLLLPVVVTLVFADRRRRGLASAEETGLVAGVWTLTAAFLLALPAIASRNALAVQLQVSRAFWLVDLFAVVLLAWWLAEGRRRGNQVMHGAADDSPPSSWRPLGLAIVLFLAALGRGVNSQYVEHPERRLIQRDLEDSDWVRTGAWVDTHMPRDAHVLADPDHDWKFGHSVRIVARRDVLLEGTKDAAIALYDRDVALRVRRRLEAIGDFGTLDADKARALAREFDLDLLLIDRDLPLTPLHRDGRFRVYQLP
jgi:hypothetical protein